MDDQVKIAGSTKPDFAMHQLNSSKAEDVMPRLDSEVFAEVVNSYLADLETAQ